MRVKTLVKKMSYSELEKYCQTHDYLIPNANDAEMADVECNEFWVDETLADRKVLYHKINQTYRRVHPAMLFNCVVIRYD